MGDGLGLALYFRFAPFGGFSASGLGYYNLYYADVLCGCAAAPLGAVFVGFGFLPWFSLFMMLQRC